MMCSCCWTSTGGGWMERDGLTGASGHMANKEVSCANKLA